MAATGERAKAKALRTVSEIDRVEESIGAMQARWKTADEKGESTEFLTLSIYQAVQRLRELEAQLPNYTANRYRLRATAIVESLDR